MRSGMVQSKLSEHMVGRFMGMAKGEAVGMVGPGGRKGGRLVSIYDLRKRRKEEEDIKSLRHQH